VPVDAGRRPVGTRVREVTAQADFDADERALVARMRKYLGRIQDMGDDERVWAIGALTSALERHLSPAPATIMRPGRTLSQTPGLCTLYRVTGDDWKAHECVGMVSSPEMAEAVCGAVNALGVPLPGA
jgi:hypothetical protein